MSAATTRDDVVVIVPGVDHRGRPAPRALRPGWSAVLSALPGGGFDVRGPHVTACERCGDLLWTDRGDQVLMATQRHYARSHGFTPAVLP